MVGTSMTGSAESKRDAHRTKLAGLLIGGSCAIVGTVALATVAVGATIVWLGMKDGVGDGTTVDKGLGLLEKLLAAIFPMVAAWVGAVIAYCFARDNFEAATKGATDLLHGFRGDRLGQISASQVMIPASRITAVRTPADNGQLLKTDVLDRFKAKKQGRIVVLNEDGSGKGFFHESVVLDFLTSAAASMPIESVTLGDMLGEPARGHSHGRAQRDGAGQQGRAQDRPRRLRHPDRQQLRTDRGLSVGRGHRQVRQLRLTGSAARGLSSSCGTCRG